MINSQELLSTVDYRHLLAAKRTIKKGISGVKKVLTLGKRAWYLIVRENAFLLWGRNANF